MPRRPLLNSLGDMGKKRRQPPMGEQHADVVAPVDAGPKRAADRDAKTSVAATADKPSPAAPPGKKASAGIDALFGGIVKKPAVQVRRQQSAQVHSVLADAVCSTSGSWCAAQKLRQQSKEQRAEEQQPKRRKGSKTDLFGNGPTPGRRCASTLYACTPWL